VEFVFDPTVEKVQGCDKILNCYSPEFVIKMNKARYVPPPLSNFIIFLFKNDSKVFYINFSNPFFKHKRHGTGSETE
jgi:hypothetical protein